MSGDRFKNCFLPTPAGSSSTAIKLLVITVPLVLVSFVIFFLVPRNSSYWVYVSPSGNSGTGNFGAVSEEVSTAAEAVAVSGEAALNRSTNKSLDAEAQVMEIHEFDETKEGSLNITTNELNNLNISVTGVLNATISLNESISLPLKQNRRVRTKLGKLEAGLQRARAAIKDAKNSSQLLDPDYVPIGPMYWDAKAFHRSYMEMEKQFKVFVYKEGEPPVFHDGPCKSIYSMEGNFIYQMDVNTKFRTNDPEKAHVFYLPFSVAKMVQFVYLRDSRDFGPIRRTVIDYVNVVSKKYLYWNRSLGADHFMLACHDWGPEASFSNPYLGKNSIRALCNANTSEKFNPVKDVSIPEMNLRTGKLTGLIGGPSASRRPILAFFAGGVHGPIRPILLEHWEGKDDEIKVHKYLPKGINYYEMMRSSKYCLCPSGYEVASPRIVEALYNGCVPVLISKSYVPPFSDVLRWKSFSVVVSVEDIPRLKEILMKISSRQYIRMQRRVLQVRRHFEFHSPPKRFDVFHMILHSIWLRRLNVRVSDGNDLNDDRPLKHRRRRWYWSDLDRLERGLQRARAAIKEAMNGSRLKDPDYSPDGPIYWNAKVFHRSYLEMEKQFKIFVYKEGEVPLFHDGPCRMIYTIEGQFINKMEINTKFRTHNPHHAHAFFLPYSVTRMRHFLHDLRSFGRVVTDYVNIITAKHPHWNRSLGADHFILACHDWGPYSSFYVPELVRNSIRALCNANTSERFDPIKDVSIPEINIRGNKLEGLNNGGLPPSKRSILAFFAGGNHGPIRPILFKHWKRKDQDIQVYEYLPKGLSYIDLMRKSKYCLCPSGYEVASPRVVEALYNGCVPVLISKDYVPPFSDVLDWKTFSVTVPIEEIGELKKRLMGIPERQYKRMQKRVVQVKRHFELNFTPKRYDVFHMILHSIWLRRLNVRLW
ncbi:putative glycosyltransferase [Gossypium australe]|uniref:Putative glycosyltransferase n=1 Tax=Gossypium australe TaxID=47621 RepID=A0A5B6V7L1_9ROSI|nr:putative glycosyltransferase [Gossypium australe]